jgi:hypothetical protein
VSIDVDILAFFGSPTVLATFYKNWALFQILLVALLAIMGSCAMLLKVIKASGQVG